MTMTMAGGVGGGPGTWNIYITNSMGFFVRSFNEHLGVFRKLFFFRIQFLNRLFGRKKVILSFLFVDVIRSYILGCPW